MHILSINGSHRGEKGWTHALLNRIKSGAESAGASCERVTLAKVKINRCLGCRKCQTTEQHLECVYADKDDAAAIFEQMKAADLLIFATPIYMMTLSGLIKTLFDRLYSTMDVNDMRLSSHGLIHHHINPAISSKPFVSLICWSNLESASAANAAHYFRTYARFMEAPHVGELFRNGTPLLDYDRDHPDQTRFPRIHRVYEAYEQAGRELAARGRISGVTQRQANQELISIPAFGLLKRFVPIKRIVIRETLKVFETDAR